MSDFLPSKETLEFWWEIIAPVCVVAGIVWWLGPIEVLTFILQALVVVVVFGFPLQVIVWIATKGR